jgi:hypothetical protein
MRLGPFILFLALITPHSICASSYETIYYSPALEHDKPRLQQEFNELLATDIQPYLTEQESQALAGLTIDSPLAGQNANPVEVFSSKGRLELPLLTMQFTEDLAQAYAWLWANHYSSETVDEYMGMLHFRPASAFPHRQYPPPLVALHIPYSALDNDAVSKMFRKVRSTAWTFLIMREFDRLRNPTDSDQQADFFALEVLKRNSEVPSGLLMIVHAILYLPPDNGEAHALTPQRLVAMADYFDTHVHEFAQGRPDARVAVTAIHLLASRLRYSADWLKDASGQQLWEEQAEKTSVSSLAPRPLK